MSFPAYPDYKNSGVEWLGDVPVQWEIKAFRRVIQKSLSNGIFKKKEDFGRGVLLINVFDVYRHNFKVDYLSLGRVDCDAAELVSYAVDAGDLFFVRSSLKYEGISVVAVADSCLEAVVYECHLIRARPNSAFFDGRYGSYLFNSTIYRAIMISKAKLTTMTTIDQEAISSTLIPVPTLYEQTQIARFLDHETARIDALIEEQQCLIELLKEKRQAVISHAVTKGLDTTVPMKDSGVEWLGKVPEHWQVVAIKWLSPVLRGASPRPIDDQKYFDESGEYAWVRIADVSASDGTLKKTTQTLSALGASLSVKMEPGEMFLSVAGTVGKPCITQIKACIHDGFVYFPSLNIDNKFLYRVFEVGTCYGGLGKMGTQLNLNTETVGGIQIGVPPEIEIARILEFIDRQLSVFNSLIDEATKGVDLLQERRSTLISAAVTGKIDVRGWQSPANAKIPELEQEAV